MVTTTQTVTENATPVLKLRADTLSNEEKLALRKHQKERLAGAFRIFAKLGYDEGVAGHITVRDVINPHAFWVNPFGRPFDEMTVSDLLLVDHDGTVLEGGKPGDGQVYNAAGYAIHSAIHAVRPDINAAAHSHSFYGRGFSALGRNIDMVNYEGATYGETVKLYSSFGGIVLSDEEGRNIAKALGPEGKGVILQNHGILTAASSVDAAVAYFVRLEKLCESQLLSDAAGVSGPGVLSDGEVDAVFSKYGGEENAFRQAQELYEWLEGQDGDAYKA